MDSTQIILIQDAQPNERIGVSADVRFAGGVGVRLSVKHVGELPTAVQIGGSLGSRAMGVNQRQKKLPGTQRQL